ncbi:MAG: ComF family protein [Acidimicrobiia bacterium]
MPCLACTGRGDVCGPCRRSLRRASARTLPNGLLVLSAYRHEGAARTLVRRLKYQGIEAAADLLAPNMAAGLQGVSALVPVPRVLIRRVRYGIDQSDCLARALGTLTGLPVLRLLRAPLWTPPRAGRNQSAFGPVLAARATGELALALVDDVVTTGATLVSAVGALSVSPIVAVTATSAL